MPHIKNALIRFRIIDRMLRNKYKPFPSKQDLRAACEESLYGSTLGEHICDSTIEKDMYAFIWYGLFHHYSLVFLKFPMSISDGRNVVVFI